jgi:hypothetical protein
MMVTTAVASDLGDYESIKTVTRISPSGVQLYVSANIPHEPSPWYKDDPPFRRVHVVVADRTEDLQHAPAYVLRISCPARTASTRLNCNLILLGCAGKAEEWP